jgi:hypothetical protein
MALEVLLCGIRDILVEVDMVQLVELLAAGHYTGPIVSE